LLGFGGGWESQSQAPSRHQECNSFGAPQGGRSGREKTREYYPRRDLNPEPFRFKK